MLSISLIFLNIIIPLGLIIWLDRSPFQSRQQWRLDWFLVSAYLLLIGFIGTWGAINYYLPFLYLCLYLFTFFRSFKMYQQVAGKPSTAQTKFNSVSRVKWSVLMTLVGLDAWALWGFSPHQQSLDINFPLSRGLYYVWNGGSSALINQCPFRDKQQHAVDIVKLNLIGVRSSDVPARGLGSYEIFGDVVQSPCDGIVVQVRQGSADSQNPVPGLEFHTGNLVAVECAGVNLYFLHLMDSSIVVEKGELVVTGQYLGVVGNSGDSEEPHLHVHAERGGVRGEIFTGESVPLHFNGRYLVRNSLVCKDCF